MSTPKVSMRFEIQEPPEDAEHHHYAWRVFAKKDGNQLHYGRCTSRKAAVDAAIAWIADNNGTVVDWE